MMKDDKALLDNIHDFVTEKLLTCQSLATSLLQGDFFKVNKELESLKKSFSKEYHLDLTESLTLTEGGRTKTITPISELFKDIATTVCEKNQALEPNQTNYESLQKSYTCLVSGEGQGHDVWLHQLVKALFVSVAEKKIKDTMKLRPETFLAL